MQDWKNQSPLSIGLKYIVRLGKFKARAVTAIFGTGPLELGILLTFLGKLGKIHIL